jgi:hypothetical protein
MASRRTLNAFRRIPLDASTLLPRSGALRAASLDQVDCIEYDTFPVLLGALSRHRARFPDCRGHSVCDRFEVVLEAANIWALGNRICEETESAGRRNWRHLHDFQPGTWSEWALMSRFRTNQEHAGLLQDQRLKEVSAVAGPMAVGRSVGSGRRRDFRSPAAPRA